MKLLYSIFVIVTDVTIILFYVLNLQNRDVVVELRS
jgi:hypothetical protein